MREMNIKFSPPDITEAEISEVAEALRSGWITTGPRTKEFEKRIAAYCGTDKAVCLNSATAGLELVLRILGVGEGDEVITSAYTYTASASVAEHVGAKLVLCDIGADGFEMDYDKLESLITERTKVIIPVDIAGIICDYEKVFAIAERKKSLFRAKNDLQRLYGRIVVLADAAHSFGAVKEGKRSGAFADFTSFSFHAVKNLTTAEGGAVVWKDMPGLDNEWLYKQFMLWSLHGQSKDALTKNQLGAWEYDIMMCGMKCNMTDIMAAIGLAQLNRYGGLLARRRQIIERYDESIRPLANVLEHYGPTHAGSGHLYLTNAYAIKNEQMRNTVIVEMAKRGIAANVHYKPLPMFTAYKNMGFSIKDFPNAYTRYANEITLPLHTLLTDEEVGCVISNFKECVAEVAKQ